MSKNHTILFVVLMVACVVICRAPAATAQQHQPATPMVKALRAEKPPKIDGRLDEACWRKAVPVTQFRQINSKSPARFGSVARVVFDSDHI